MMTLLGNIEDQPVASDHARTLIHGQPGTGKTSLAATIAEVGKTLFLYVPGEEGIGSLKGIDHEDNVTLYRLGSQTGNPIKEIESLYWDLYNDKHDYKAVCIDSVSAIQDLLSKHLMNLPLDRPLDKSEIPKRDYDFWEALRNWFTDYFTFWYSLASQTNKNPMHVIMTSQTKALDDVEGDEKMQPDLYKGGLASATTRPDQILYTHMARDPEDFDKQRHVVRILPSSTVTAKTRCAPEIQEKLPPVMGLKSRVTLPKYLRILQTAGV